MSTKDKQESIESREEKIRISRRKYYLLNKEKIKKKVAEWYQNNKERVLAYGKERHERLRAVPGYLKEKNERSKKRYIKNRERILNYYKERRARIRKNLIEFLGKSRCAWCGNKDYRVLQIDHINGGGRKETRETHGISNYKRYEEHILKNPQNYQILCANCNWIKRHEKNEVR